MGTGGLNDYYERIEIIKPKSVRDDVVSTLSLTLQQYE